MTLRTRNPLNVQSNNSAQSNVKCPQNNLKKTPKRVICTKMYRSGKTLNTLKEVEKECNHMKQNDPSNSNHANENLRELKIYDTPKGGIYN